VIQADGGTRTASITGAYVALYDALRLIGGDRLMEAGLLMDMVAAVSVGVVENIDLVDLTYEEDSGADVDMNVVMTGSGTFIEIQGTAEKSPFSRAQMDNLLVMAEKAIAGIIAIQRNALQV
jgi:ribonuclease PH